MPKKCSTYHLLCEMASFLKFDKGVTILLLDPVLHIVVKFGKHEVLKKEITLENQQPFAIHEIFCNNKNEFYDAINCFLKIWKT